LRRSAGIAPSWVFDQTWQLGGDEVPDDLDIDVPAVDPVLAHQRCNWVIIGDAWWKAMQQSCIAQ
jgi:hypothetical protein